MPLYATRCKGGGYHQNSLPIINGSEGGTFEKKAAAGTLDIVGLAVAGNIVTLYADEPGFVSFGVAPNAQTDTGRFFIPAGTEKAFSVFAGHKVAWYPGAA